MNRQGGIQEGAHRIGSFRLIGRIVPKGLLDGETGLVQFHRQLSVVHLSVVVMSLTAFGLCTDFGKLRILAQDFYNPSDGDTLWDDDIDSHAIFLGFLPCPGWF